MSGTARLMDAIMVLLLLLSGVAGALALLPTISLEATIPEGPQWWRLLTQGVAVLVAGRAFLILFAVPRAQALWAMFGCLLAWAASWLGARYGGHPGAGAFVGTLALGLYANALARWKDRPAQVFLLPGLVLLVPGAFGFLSFEQLLRGEVAGGVSGVFMTMVLASSLVLGVLVSNAALPPRKAL